MQRDQGQREWLAGPLGEKGLAFGTQTLGKGHGFAKPKSRVMRDRLG